MLLGILVLCNAIGIEFRKHLFKIFNLKLFWYACKSKFHQFIPLDYPDLKRLVFYHMLHAREWRLVVWSFIIMLKIWNACHMHVHQSKKSSPENSSVNAITTAKKNLLKESVGAFSCSLAWNTCNWKLNNSRFPLNICLLNRSALQRPLSMTVRESDFKIQGEHLNIYINIYTPTRSFNLLHNIAWHDHQ